MRVIATAGHVDHGKSTLVEALTGIHPDRLAEEKARQMTIDLGFAWLRLGNGETVGVVDVPGHEDFIENMLAGVGGIDAAILVIAADEGVMPQTREHLAILDLLNISTLIVALTKVDLVEDDDWLELVILDIEEKLAETHFQDSEIIPVSAFNGDGIEDLLKTLQRSLDRTPKSSLSDTPRLPIDRVFSVSGFGTVVTGTLADGNLEIGDTVEIAPHGITARIRGLQSHNEDVENAVAGSRVAVNLAGIDKDQIDRGDVVTVPEYIFPTTLLDVELSLLNDTLRPLKHNAEIKLFVGPSETVARVRLLESNEVSLGQTTWAQLMLENPLPLIRGQRFIIRYPSPPATIGGGVILDTAPGRKWKRNQDYVQARFTRLASGRPIDLVSELLIQHQRPMTMVEILQKTHITTQRLDEVIQDQQIVLVGDWLLHLDVLERFADRIEGMLHTFHDNNPLKIGMSLHQLQNQLRIKQEDAFLVLIELLSEHEVIEIITRKFAKLPHVDIRFTTSQQTAVNKLMSSLEESPYTPPSVKEAIEILGDAKLLDSLLDQQQIIQIGNDVILSHEVYTEWVQFTYKYLQTHNGIQLSEFRDNFNTSRKYGLAFLDHLESLQLTRRSDNTHHLGRADWSAILRLV